MIKKCSCCGEEKTAEKFSFRKDRDTFRNICRSCNHQSQRINYYKRKKEEPFAFKHTKLKNSCLGRGIEYNLTPEFLKGIWTGICPVSGKEIFFGTDSKEQRTHPQAAELDRFIPELGYTKGNVSWVSREFNIKKLNSTVEDMRKLLHFMENHEPLKEAYAELTLYERQDVWNKGLTMPDGYGQKGSDNGASKLTDEKVLEIRKLWEGKRGQITQFSRGYGVSTAAIRKIVFGKTWKHLL
jgi:hypothetical protein